MSTYEKLQNTTSDEKEILREHFLNRIWELEDQIKHASKYTKINELKKLVQCNKMWLYWINEPPTDTLQ